MISAKIIKDSINAENHSRLTTFLLTYPRYILAEFNTHRTMARNTASSRAIPMARFRKGVEEDPVLPSHWGANQKGMQADQELDDNARIWGSDVHFDGPLVTARVKALELWLRARDQMAEIHAEMEEVGLHKQIANRILEPWMWVQTLCTATDYENFFSLRCHRAAHPDIQTLADQMLEAYVAHSPTVCQVGEWHMPFGDQDIPADMPTETRLKVCVARAARISYLNFEGKIDYDKDCALADDLSKSGHWSPFEHVAISVKDGVYYGNFRGWKQLRKHMAGENRQVSLKELLEQRKIEKGVTSFLT
jgi:hypothetical protein